MDLGTRHSANHHYNPPDSIPIIENAFQNAEKPSDLKPQTISIAISEALKCRLTIQEQWSRNDASDTDQ